MPNVTVQTRPTKGQAKASVARGSHFKRLVVGRSLEPLVGQNFHHGCSVRWLHAEICSQFPIAFHLLAVDSRMPWSRSFAGHRVVVFRNRKGMASVINPFRGKPPKFRLFIVRRNFVWPTSRFRGPDTLWRVPCNRLFGVNSFLQLHSCRVVRHRHVCECEVFGSRCHRM